MPKHLNRPTNAVPPYPWKSYIESIEAKVDRLQTELDKMRAAQQQPSLFGDDGAAPTAAPTIAQTPVPERTSPFADAPDENRLGGFRGDGDTSLRAAIENYPRSGTQRNQILLAVMRKGQHGMTFDEVRQEEGIYSADRRMSELVDGGWLERTERERRTQHGSMANVMIASQKAIEWVRVRDPQAYAAMTQR